MKRFIYYILLLAAVVGSALVALFVPSFMPSGAGLGATGMQTIETFIKGVADKSHEFSAAAANLFTYALALFVVLNAALALILILIYLISGFNLNKIAKFYRICIWLFVSALIISGFYAYLVVTLVENVSFQSLFEAIPFVAYVPLLCSLFILILAIICRVSEKRK